MFGFILGTKIGRGLGLAVILLALFLANNAYQRNAGADEFRAEMEKINADFAKGAIDARKANAECNAIDGLYWDFGALRCTENID